MCYYPIKAIPQPYGRPIFHPDGKIEVPCGKCAECVSARASEWATRCQHEASLHKAWCFITLTYEDEKLPKNLLDRKKEFQKFKKRLDKKLKIKMPYLVSHEFGKKTARLHHHAIIFGFFPPDAQFYKKTPKGHSLYKSKILTDTWKQGLITVAEANGATSYYVASYGLKSQEIEVMSEQGEMFKLKDTMDSSKRPAIGLKFLHKYHAQLAARGERLPRYYVKKMEELVTLTPKQLAKKTPEELQLLASMYQSFLTYKYNQEENIKMRNLYHTYSKKCIDEAKLELNSEFRENPGKTIEQVMQDKYFKEETMSFLSQLKTSEKEEGKKS